MKTNILGTDYTVFLTDLNNRDFANADGQCYVYDKMIGLREKRFLAGDTEKGNNERFEQVIRHEIVHAYCQESGVCYDDNEELTDWIARMIPKMNRTYEDIMRQINDYK